MDKTALWFIRKENKLVECLLCPHRCSIKPGQFGLCSGRHNQNGEMVCDNYGQIAAISLDPIEKKPLRKFFPGSSILSVGTFGCNLHCSFCQNYSIARSSVNKIKTKFISPTDLVKTAIDYNDKGNIGLAFTYNEPVIWYEYVLETAKLAKKAQLKTVLVTNGYVCNEPLENLLPYIDAMNIDMKAFSDSFYKEFTGGKIEPVKNTIFKAFKNCHIEVTSLIIPGLNDSDKDMFNQAVWLSDISKDIPLHLTRFFPQYKMLSIEPTPRKTLYRLKSIAEKYLDNVYLGNI